MLMGGLIVGLIGVDSGAITGLVTGDNISLLSLAGCSNIVGLATGDNISLLSLAGCDNISLLSIAGCNIVGLGYKHLSFQNRVYDFDLTLDSGANTVVMHS